MTKPAEKPEVNKVSEERKPKREQVLKLRKTERKLDGLAMVRHRAAARTKSRIMAELKEKELKALEIKAAKGEISPEEFDALSA